MTMQKTRKLFSIFAKLPWRGRSKWVQQSPMAFPKDRAIHVFQSALLFGVGIHGRKVELRPVKPTMGV